jgi:hypothetical protein
MRRLGIAAGMQCTSVAAQCAVLSLVTPRHVRVPGAEAGACCGCRRDRQCHELGAAAITLTRRARFDWPCCSNINRIFDADFSAVVAWDLRHDSSDSVTFRMRLQ